MSVANMNAPLALGVLRKAAGGGRSTSYELNALPVQASF